MDLAYDHLAALAADELLLDDSELLLAETEDCLTDIRWESAPASFTLHEPGRAAA
jgi:hypothetical protein